MSSAVNAFAEPAAPPASAPAAPAPPAVTPPAVLTHVDAVYPESALAAREHGDVVLALTVDVDGHVSKVDVLESGGAALDEAAIIAARQWTFTPAERGGRPVASRIRVPFHFAPPAPPPELVPEPVKTEPEVSRQTAALPARRRTTPTPEPGAGTRAAAESGTAPERQTSPEDEEVFV
ncbi:MAG TPA: energy transducer TonB, partial [Polyangiaceae bacterium]|nr:energy transducer TonB [Polyangiaceae bacterium]